MKQNRMLKTKAYRSRDWEQDRLNRVHEIVEKAEESVLYSE